MATKKDDWTVRDLTRKPAGYTATSKDGEVQLELLSFKMSYQGGPLEQLTNVPFEQGTTADDLARWCAEDSVNTKDERLRLHELILAAGLRPYEADRLAQSTATTTGAADVSLDYEHGDCALFAVALHRLSGLPLRGLIEYNEEVGATVLIHAFVRVDEHTVLDASGETTVADILAKYPNWGDADLVGFTEDELLDLGYAGNPPPIALALSSAQQVLAQLPGYTGTGHSRPTT